MALPELSADGHLEPRLRPWPPAMAVGMRVTARCDQAVRAAVSEPAVAVTLADLAAGRLPDSVAALTWGLAEA